MSGDLKDNPFAVGLKKVISEKFESQVEFAENLTSKVNLSNVLSGKTGTSRRMRRAMAEKAGMSVEEITALGLQNVAPSNPSNLRKRQLVSIGSDDIRQMSSNEVFGFVGDATADITEEVAHYTRTLNSIVTVLADERDRFILHLNRDQSILNAIDDRLQVIDRKLKVAYCNRAATEKAMTMVDTEIDPEWRDICEKVFLEGKTCREIRTTETLWETYIAYPILSTAGTVNRVVLLIRDLGSFDHTLKEMGWTPPNSNDASP